MVLARVFRFPASRNVQMLFAAFGLMAVFALISSVSRKPRPWRVNEVPVAFWSWRNQTPSETEIRSAIEKVKARTLFLRAGQIDYQDGKLSRIRPVSGAFSKEIELHLVYNATRSLLRQLDAVDERALAKAISQAFEEDSRRAETEHARVVGLQVDIDVPTRLLAKYETTLRSLKARLQPGIQLSITGLPTWMQSSELRSTLTQVDFWVPQFYGAEIPLRADQTIPISSPRDVERFVDQAREINKSFYAGLAAYSYALQYSSAGALVTLRGDMDPAAIATDTNLELTELRPFPAGGGEWRYVYRARADGVTDGVAVRAGDLLVLDTPSAESLRAAAKIVRNLAGRKLLGICVFRLPADDDPATLTIEQVAIALADQPSTPDFKISVGRAQDETAWEISLENQGTASATGSIRIDLPVAAGSIETVNAGRHVSIQTICRFAPAGEPVSQPCSQNRANLIRLIAPGLRSRQAVRAWLRLRTPLPNTVPVSIETQIDSGQPFVDQISVPVEGGIKP